MTEQQAQHEVVTAGIWTGQKFTAYRADELRNMYQFKYLGQILLHDDNGILAVSRNLKLTRAN